MRLLIAGLLCSSPVLAQGSSAVPSAQGDIDLTIYSDLALIEDVRNVDLPTGTVRYEFADVSASILPETVSLTGAGIDIS